MSRLEYLGKLEKELKKQLSKKEVDDIIRDYAEYFEEGKRQGKSDDEIAISLGEPTVMAAQIISESNMSTQEFANTLNKGITASKSVASGLGAIGKAILFLIMLMILTPVFLGVGGVILGAIFGFFAFVFAVLMGLLGMFIAGGAGIFAVMTVMAVIPNTAAATIIFFSIAIMALSVALTCGVLGILKYVLNLIKRFVLYIGRTIKHLGNKTA